MNYLLALLCVMSFSLTVPFTRLAALEAAPELVTLLRLLGGGLVCILFIAHDKWLPPRPIWRALLLTSFCSVVAFASLMAFALRQVPGSHGAVALAALPAVTAAYASLRDRHNPGGIFWLFALLGTLFSAAFFLTEVKELMLGDILLGAAVFVAAMGYVEGARLSRHYGGPRIMAWAIALTLPITLLIAVICLFSLHFAQYQIQVRNLTPAAIGAIVYLALISQTGGMFLWYSVLARGQMEKIALVQLLQPFFTLLAAVFILREEVSNNAWWIALLVGACVLGASRAKSKPGLKKNPVLIDNKSLV